jgi:hypothetical protein
MNLPDTITYYVEFVFPQLAVKHNWPIRFDHCFRRVIYDQCFGGKWDKYIKPPAYKNMTDNQLESCITICLSIVDEPSLMTEFNTQSLLWRSHDKSNF